MNLDILLKHYLFVSNILENEEKPKKHVDSQSGSDDDDDDDEEGSIDLFEEGSENSGDDEAKTARFKDYFVSKEEDNEPKRKKNR